MDKELFVTRAELIKKKLYKIAYLYLGEEALALEAVDEAIYKGYKSRKKLREEAYFDTWVVRIVINECKKELKRLLKISFTITEEVSEVYDALPLKEAVAKLPPDLKEVIILRYFSDYTLEQTAATLEIPQGTVVTRQRKALKLLKLELGEE